MIAPPPADPAATAALLARVQDAGQRRLGRSLALFHLPTGGCNGCEMELKLLDDVAYALSSMGLSFVATPVEADVLVATGPLCRAMAEPLRQAWAAMAGPKWCMAIGDCAADGGVFRGSYAVWDGIAAGVPVDVVVRGCPPGPADVLAALSVLLEVNTLP